ncbi:hypothetical protein WJX77_005828 [Trebouxia sp. C0004]
MSSWGQFPSSDARVQVHMAVFDTLVLRLSSVGRRILSMARFAKLYIDDIKATADRTDTDAATDGGTKEVVATLVREVDELKLVRLAAASTTTDRVSGQTWIKQAKHTSDILAGIQQLSYGGYAEAAQQAKARLMGFQQQQQQPPRKKHKKLSATIARSGNFGSRLMDLIQICVDGQVWLFLLSSSLRTVSFPTALGQLVNRIRRTIVSNLQQQPDRQQAFAVVITMQSIEVFQFTRRCGSPFNLQRSGRQDCTGFQWLVRVIHGTLADLGCMSSQLHWSTELRWSYRQAVLKLNRNERESEVLKELGTVSNFVQLLGHGAVESFKGQAWHAILIRPFGRLLGVFRK